MIRILFIPLLSCLISLGVNSHSTASSLSLKEKIQSELTLNHSLEKRKIILNIVKIEDGRVTIAMSAGNPKIRKSIKIDGYNIQSAPFKGSTSDDKNDISVINNALEVIRNMSGVKSVLLTGYHSDGSVMVPVGASTNHFYSSSDPSDKRYFGFSLRCNRFDVENDFETEITILENDEEIITTTIGPYRPFIYKKYIISNSRYQAYDEFVIDIENLTTGNKKDNITVAYHKMSNWSESDMRFGVINAEVAGKHFTRAKLWFRTTSGEAETFWAKMGQEIKIEHQGNDYVFRVNQLYSVGLNVVYNGSLPKVNKYPWE